MNETAPKLTREELNSLPENVREYIAALEAQVQSLKSSVQYAEGEAKRSKIAYWKSK